MSPSWPSNAMIGMKRLDVRAFCTRVNQTKRNCVKSQRTKRRCVTPELTLSVFMYCSRIALFGSASTRAISYLRFPIVTFYRSRTGRTIEIRTRSFLFDTAAIQIRTQTNKTWKLFRPKSVYVRITPAVVCYLAFEVIFTGANVGTKAVSRQSRACSQLRIGNSSCILIFYAPQNRVCTGYSRLPSVVVNRKRTSRESRYEIARRRRPFGRLMVDDIDRTLRAFGYRVLTWRLI